jgi:hypothetical protein
VLLSYEDVTIFPNQNIINAYKQVVTGVLEDAI